MSLPSAVKNALIVGDAQREKKLKEEREREEANEKRRKAAEDNAVLHAVEWCTVDFPVQVTLAAANGVSSVKLPNKYVAAELRRKGITVRIYEVPESTDPDMRYDAYDEYYVDLDTLRRML